MNWKQITNINSLDKIGSNNQQLYQLFETNQLVNWIHFDIEKKPSSKPSAIEKTKTAAGKLNRSWFFHNPPKKKQSCLGSPSDSEARLLFRLSLASALAVVFRQLLFGAFKRHGHEATAPYWDFSGRWREKVLGEFARFWMALDWFLIDFHGFWMGYGF